MNDLEARWRVDDSDPRIVHACYGARATPSDPVVGVQATPEAGRRVVKDHNRSLAQTAWSEGHTAGEFDAVHPNQAATPNPYTPGWFYLG